MTRRSIKEYAEAVRVLVVYTETEYGIFDVEEFAHLSGNPPKRFHRFRPQT